jgi:hypothetical protein
MLRILTALSLALLAACASTSSSGASGHPTRLTFVDYRSGQAFELVNESHTDRLEQYSELRSNAARKVLDDGTMERLVEFLEDQGFETRSRPGSTVPPSQVRDGALQWALELDRGDGVRHVAAVPGMSDDDKRGLLTLGKAFLDTYNATFSMQAVKVEDVPFQIPPPVRRR